MSRGLQHATDTTLQYLSSVECKNPAAVFWGQIASAFLKDGQGGNSPFLTDFRQKHVPLYLIAVHYYFVDIIQDFKK